MITSCLLTANMLLLLAITQRYSQVFITRLKKDISCLINCSITVFFFQSHQLWRHSFLASYSLYNRESKWVLLLFLLQIWAANRRDYRFEVLHLKLHETHFAFQHVYNFSWHSWWSPVLCLGPRGKQTGKPATRMHTTVSENVCFEVAHQAPNKTLLNPLILAIVRAFCLIFFFLHYFICISRPMFGRITCT